MLQRKLEELGKDCKKEVMPSFTGQEEWEERNSSGKKAWANAQRHGANGISRKWGITECGWSTWGQKRRVLIRLCRALIITLRNLGSILCEKNKAMVNIPLKKRYKNPISL